MIRQIEIANFRGVFKKENMNIVQENLAAIYNLIKQKQENELEESRFEQQLFINNPPMYKEYAKKKQDDIDSGNADVTWIAPESVEEAKHLLNVFEDIDKQIKEDPNEIAANEEFVKQIGLLGLLGGIDIDEVGSD